MSNSRGIVGFVVDFSDTPVRTRKYDPSQEYPRPVTDEEVAARIKYLTADNAHMRARFKQLRQNQANFAEAESAQMLADRERRRRNRLSGWYGGNR